MNKGGMMKKGYAKGGMKKKGYAMGGMMKKMARGGFLAPAARPNEKAVKAVRNVMLSILQQSKT